MPSALLSAERLNIYVYLFLLQKILSYKAPFKCPFPSCNFTPVSAKELVLHYAGPQHHVFQQVMVSLDTTAGSNPFGYASQTLVSKMTKEQSYYWRIKKYLPFIENGLAGCALASAHSHNHMHMQNFFQQYYQNNRSFTYHLHPILLSTIVHILE